MVETEIYLAYLPLWSEFKSLRFDKITPEISALCVLVFGIRSALIKQTWQKAFTLPWRGVSVWLSSAASQTNESISRYLKESHGAEWNLLINTCYLTNYVECHFHAFVIHVHSLVFHYVPSQLYVWLLCPASRLMHCFSGSICCLHGFHAHYALHTLGNNSKLTNRIINCSTLR